MFSECSPQPGFQVAGGKGMAPRPQAGFPATHRASRCARPPIVKAASRNFLKIAPRGYIFLETARRGISKNIQPLGGSGKRFRETALEWGSRAHRSARRAGPLGET